MTVRNKLREKFNFDFFKKVQKKHSCFIIIAEKIKIYLNAENCKIFLFTYYIFTKIKVEFRNHLKKRGDAENPKE